MLAFGPVGMQTKPVVCELHAIQLLEHGLSVERPLVDGWRSYWSSIECYPEWLTVAVAACF